MQRIWDLFRSAIFAGVCIGIAGFGFLAGKQLGMILFIFGLATVVSYKLKLFTGTAGFVHWLKPAQDGTPVRPWQDYTDLLIILLGNIAGCLLVSLIARCSPLPMGESAETLLSARLATGPLRCGALAIGCGILMTTAVNFARKSKEIGNWVPLLFAVPLFIHCGFPHCIADAFYYLTAPVAFLSANAGRIVLLYLCIVLGNFIGCNLYRAFIKE